MKNKTVWSWGEFHRAMKAAGWERIDKSDPAKVYTHPSGAKFYPHTFSKFRAKKYASGEAWHEYAVLNKTPEPIPF